MSEINRVALKSFGSQKVNDKNEKELGKTLRIALILPESNEDTCPEFDYKEELATAKKKDKTVENKNGHNFMDPFFDNDDDDVRRIAQQMEAKYGTSVPSKKKRKPRKDDYADIGAGYDESDSFIDNTDGYDEMIPQNVTTLHGGFYINSGALEFKTDDEASSDVSSSSSSDDEVENNHNASRKRKIVSSDDSEGENETENPDTNNINKKVKLSDVNNGKLPSKKSVNKDDMKRIKKHKAEDKKKSNTVKELLIEEGKDLNVSVSAVLLDQTIVDSETDKKENKKPMSLNNVNNSIESVIKCSKGSPVKVEEKGSPISTEIIMNNNATSVNNIKPETVNLQPDDLDNSSNDAPKLEAEIVKLPENLPNDIFSLIDSVKAEAAKLDGKGKTFSGSVNSKLLILERKFKCLGKQSRMRVYEHLAPFLKCRKETIIKRAKNLVLIDDKKKITDLLASLRVLIEEIMRPLLENYTLESHKIMQKKYSKDTTEGEDIKILRMPKRRFSWTEEIKKLFKELILLRKRCYILEGKHKNNIENQMENFIKTEVQTLWPEGWMTMHALLKLYNNFSESNKQSKSLDKKHSQTDTPTTSTSSSNNITNTAPINATSKEMQKIQSNSTLSIIPVVSTSKANQENNVKNEIVIDKVSVTESGNSSSTSGSKTKKSLPVDISKTSNAITITPTTSTATSGVNMQKHEERKSSNVETKRSIINEVIIVEDKQKKSVIESLTATSNNADGSKKLEHKHCQIIDLTENSEARRRSASKSKSKYHGDTDDNNHSKSNSKLNDVNKNDNTKDMTASSAYNNIIQESLSELNRYPQNLKSTSNATQSTNKLTDHSIKKLSTPSNYANSVDHMKFKLNSEGDDIQKVMEGLKALQNMASPKSKPETSSPVSVISFSKNHGKQNNYANPQAASYSKCDFNSGFQEAFQRQLLNDCSLIKNPSTILKSHYNTNNDKYAHSNNVGYSTGYSNNNYSQQNNKINPAHQSGSYNVLDDMLSNFLSDYGYSKSANHKQKSTHSHK